MEAIDGTTIFSVGEEAGVSITTVSHVFSGKRHVSAATRERVLAVAEELGYQPTASARALATRRTMTVALQHSVGGPEDMINPWMGTMLTAMSEAAMRASYSFLPVVSLGRLESHPELLSLDNDHMALAKSVLAHFADVGYRRPALMSPCGRGCPTSWTTSRRSGSVRAAPP